MKNLSVVFLIFKDKEKYFICLGKQAAGKKLAGIRNGFGGKCEVKRNGKIETTLECAIRELQEETNLFFEENKFEKCGAVIMDEKLIDFFIIFVDKKLVINDNLEFVDVKWFDIFEKEEFINGMLNGDEMVIDGVINFLQNGKQFLINKTGNKILEEQTKNIFNNFKS